MTGTRRCLTPPLCVLGRGGGERELLMLYFPLCSRLQSRASAEDKSQYMYEVTGFKLKLCLECGWIVGFAALVWERVTLPLLHEEKLSYFVFKFGEKVNWYFRTLSISVTLASQGIH